MDYVEWQAEERRRKREQLFDKEGEAFRYYSYWAEETIATGNIALVFLLIVTFVFWVAIFADPSPFFKHGWSAIGALLFVVLVDIGTLGLLLSTGRRQKKARRDAFVEWQKAKSVCDEIQRN